MDLSELVTIAHEAVTAAGQILSKRFASYRDLPVSSKSSPSDLVSAADREAERAIVELVRHRRPEDSILGEEEGESARGSSGVRWIIDPLDGTANFLTGNPHWCVSVGVEHEGREVLGAVFDPLRDELFLAADDVPLSLNGRAVLRPPPRALNQAILATGFSYDATRRRAQAVKLLGMVGAVADIRRGGAAALDLAWTAVGRLDAYLEHDLSPWDAAAGRVLCRRAGLRIVELEPADGLPAGLLVSSPALCEALHELAT